MIIKTLLTLLRTPDPDAVLNKPFHHERRFVSDTPDAVKHEHKQNIEFSLLGSLLDDLQLVPVFSSNLKRNGAVNSPAAQAIYSKIQAHMKQKSKVRETGK